MRTTMMWISMRMDQVSSRAQMEFWAPMVKVEARLDQDLRRKCEASRIKWLISKVDLQS